MNPDGDDLGQDVASVADFLAALVPILGAQAALADVAGYLDEAKGSAAHLAVLRAALESRRLAAQVPPRAQGARR